jgi:hypothetical protein
MMIDAVESCLHMHYKAIEEPNNSTSTTTTTESASTDATTAATATSEQQQSRSQPTAIAKAYIECMLTLSSSGNLTRDELESLAAKLLLATSAQLPRKLDRFLFKRCLLKLIQTNKSNYTITIDEVLKELTPRFVQITTDGAILNEVFYFFIRHELY